MALEKQKAEKDYLISQATQNKLKKDILELQLKKKLKNFRLKYCDISYKFLK